MVSSDGIPAGLFSIKKIGVLVTLTAVVMVSAVFVTLGVTTGVRALYVVFGSAIFLAGALSNKRLQISITADKVSKFLIVVSITAVTTSYFSSRVVGLAILIIGFLTLAWTTALCDFSPHRNVVHILALFVTVTTSKFVSTNAYFGNGDIIGHTAAITQLISGGPSAITRGVYSDFPGLHIAAAVVRVVTGLSAYVALTTVGIIAISLSILVVFLFYSNYVFNPQIAVAAALLYATFEQTVFYATYVFPQTLAVVFALLLIFTLLKSQENKNIGEYSLIAVLFAWSTILTHHFTIILFTPVVGLLVLTDITKIVRNRFTLGTTVRGVGLTLWIGVASIYWQSTNWSPDAIIWAINQMPLGETITSLFANDSPTGSTPTGSTPTISEISEPSTAVETVWGPAPDFAFGVSVITDTVPRALLALVEPSLLYQTALITLVMLGIVVVWRDQFAFDTNLISMDTDRILLFVLSAGALLLLIKTPIQPKGIARIQMAWAAFAVFIPAIGIGKIITGDSRLRFNRVVLTIVITLAVVSGPLAAADDTTAFQLSVDRTKEVELAHDERQLQAVAAFGSQTDSKISGPWVTREAIKWDGSSVRPVVATERGLRPDSSLLIVRERWSTQVVKIRQKESIIFDNAYFSRQNIKHAENGGQKIYTSGDVSVLFAHNKTVTFTVTG